MPKEHTFSDILKLTPISSRLIPITFSEKLIRKFGPPLKTILCECSCGQRIVVPVQYFLSGNKRSCGCLRRETVSKMSRKYEYNPRLLSRQYKQMLNRCYNPKQDSFRWYGARGVTVCDEWRTNYGNFLKWALSNGWEPHLQLDKDKKIPGNMIYSPDACCFLTSKENNQYRRKRGTAL